jgi:hypothetical protein
MLQGSVGSDSRTLITGANLVYIFWIRYIVLSNAWKFRLVLFLVFLVVSVHSETAQLFPYPLR